MIVRVRSNLGSTRLQLTCGPETILVDLIALVRAALNIREAGAGAGNSDNVQLAADLAGERLLNSSEATLRQLGVAHGDELFLVGRWEVVTVGVGSFVSGEGELVARGTLRRIDAPAVTTPGTADTAPAVNTTDFSETPSPAAQTEKRGRGERKAGEMEERGEVAVAATAPTTVNVTAHTNTAVPISLAVPELESPYASVPASTLTAMAMAAAAEERDRGGWDWGGDGDGELVRAPDAVRREALLGPDSPWGAGGAGRGLQLLAGDELQLRERGAFLRGAGMREGEVQAEVGELRDLLLAQRLQVSLTQQEQARGRALSHAAVAGMLQIEQLESALRGSRERRQAWRNQSHSLGLSPAPDLGRPSLGRPRYGSSHDAPSPDISLRHGPSRRTHAHPPVASSSASPSSSGSASASAGIGVWGAGCGRGMGWDFPRSSGAGVGSARSAVGVGGVGGAEGEVGRARGRGATSSPSSEGGSVGVSLPPPQPGLGLVLGRQGHVDAGARSAGGGASREGGAVYQPSFAPSLSLSPHLSSLTVALATGAGTGAGMGAGVRTGAGMGMSAGMGAGLGSDASPSSVLYGSRASQLSHTAPKRTQAPTPTRALARNAPKPSDRSDLAPPSVSTPSVPTIISSMVSPPTDRRRPRGTAGGGGDADAVGNRQRGRDMGDGSRNFFRTAVPVSVSVPVAPAFATDAFTAEQSTEARLQEREDAALAMALHRSMQDQPPSSPHAHAHSQAQPTISFNPSPPNSAPFSYYPSSYRPSLSPDEAASTTLLPSYVASSKRPLRHAPQGAVTAGYSPAHMGLGGIETRGGLGLSSLRGRGAASSSGTASVVSRLGSGLGIEGSGVGSGVGMGTSGSGEVCAGDARRGQGGAFGRVEAVATGAGAGPRARQFQVEGDRALASVPPFASNSATRSASRPAWLSDAGDTWGGGFRAAGAGGSVVESSVEAEMLRAVLLQSRLEHDRKG